MKIAVIYGTRPEAIKLAPAVVALRKTGDHQVHLICTGQHKELLYGILDIWNLKNDFELSVEFDRSPLGSFTKIAKEIEKLFENYKYDLVIVQGDTSSALAGTIAAHFFNYPVAHVEAGLRSGDTQNPWPEEGNRRAIDALSALHFAPTEASARNLFNEGYGASVSITGNTVVDALEHVKNRINLDPNIESELQRKTPFSLNSNYLLFTQHRRESFSGGIDSVFNAIKSLAEKGEKIVFPVHLNPNVAERAKELLANNPNIWLLPPLNYLEFLVIVKHCKLIISDSGGLQEEAPSFNKKILITRKTTERPEILSSGYGELVGFDSELIIDRVMNFDGLGDVIRNPFGQGDASELIKNRIQNFLG
jgi:UDP-N-acetylglucosamine 2-epimerase (non-hydrolysing)